MRLRKVKHFVRRTLHTQQPQLSSRVQTSDCLVSLESGESRKISHHFRVPLMFMLAVLFFKKVFHVFGAYVNMHTCACHSMHAEDREQVLVVGSLPQA